MRKRMLIGSGLILCGAAVVLAFLLWQSNPDHSCFDCVEIGMPWEDAARHLEANGFIPMAEYGGYRPPLQNRFENDDGDMIVLWISDPARRVIQKSWQPRERTLAERVSRLWIRLGM